MVLHDLDSLLINGGESSIAHHFLEVGGDLRTLLLELKQLIKVVLVSKDKSS